MRGAANGTGVSRGNAEQWLRSLGRSCDVGNVTRPQPNDERCLLALDYLYAKWSRPEGHDQNDA